METSEEVADRVRRALPHRPVQRIIVVPDCGLKYLTREVAFDRIRSNTAGAKIVRQSLT